jgi:hypothetical protein
MQKDERSGGDRIQVYFTVHGMRGEAGEMRQSQIKQLMYQFLKMSGDKGLQKYLVLPMTTAQYSVM